MKAIVACIQRQRHMEDRHKKLRVGGLYHVAPDTNRRVCRQVLEAMAGNLRALIAVAGT